MRWPKTLRAEPHRIFQHLKAQQKWENTAQAHSRCEGKPASAPSIYNTFSINLRNFGIDTVNINITILFLIKEAPHIFCILKIKTRNYIHGGRMFTKNCERSFVVLRPSVSNFSFIRFIFFFKFSEVVIFNKVLKVKRVFNRETL